MQNEYGVITQSDANASDFTRPSRSSLFSLGNGNNSGALERCHLLRRFVKKRQEQGLLYHYKIECIHMSIAVATANRYVGFGGGLEKQC